MFAFIATVLVPGFGHLYVGDWRVALAVSLTLSVIVQARKPGRWRRTSTAASQSWVCRGT